MVKYQNLIIIPETILLSDNIIKINRFNFSQSRFIVITDKAIYNFQKKSTYFHIIYIFKL